MSQTVIPDNPFELRTVAGRRLMFYQGQEAFLAGIYAPTDRLDGDFNAMMRVLADRKNNFFRHWTTNYYLYAPGITTPTGEHPRKRYSPFKWNVSKWEMSDYNFEYFTRLRAMITAARNAGIVVQITIFDRAGLAAGSDRWPNNPWNSINNLNNLIQDGSTGVPKFYDRNIQGHIRIREPLDPQTGTGGFTLEPISLGELQDNFVSQVVSQTKEFKNVVYEIMNEPMTGTTAQRVEWANKMVGVIHAQTQGKRLIFYNDHTGNLNNPATRGVDVNYWKSSIPAARSNYSRFHGVIFHGDPNLIDPANANTNSWTFEADKIIQVSSDAYAGPRDDYHWTRDTTTRAFGRHMMYQAESVATRAAEGIRDATPKPTLLRFV